MFGHTWFLIVQKIKKSKIILTQTKSIDLGPTLSIKPSNLRWISWGVFPEIDFLPMSGHKSGGRENLQNKVFYFYYWIVILKLFWLTHEWSDILCFLPDFKATFLDDYGPLGPQGSNKKRQKYKYLGHSNQIGTVH